MSSRSATPRQLEREKLGIQAKELYEQGHSFAEIGQYLGVHEITACRWAKKQGVKLRKKHNYVIKDGDIEKKKCCTCGEVKPLSEFYQIMSRGKPRPSSYCKPCNISHATKRQRQRRDLIKKQVANKKKERLRHNERSRLLLNDAMCIIAKLRPDHEIVSDIYAHLSLGKKLF